MSRENIPHGRPRVNLLDTIKALVAEIERLEKMVGWLAERISGTPGSEYAVWRPTKIKGLSQLDKKASWIKAAEKEAEAPQ